MNFLVESINATFRRILCFHYYIILEAFGSMKFDNKIFKDLLHHKSYEPTIYGNSTMAAKPDMEASGSIKVAKKLSCKNCDYITSNKSDYKKHLLTRKHIMETSGEKKVAKKLFCEKCSYLCSKQSDFDKHLTSHKHITETKNIERKNIYSCNICNKQYKSRGSCWKHQQKCSGNTNIIETSTDIQPEIDMNKGGNTVDVTLFMELLKQNQEFKQLLVEQQRDIVEQQLENQKQQQENQRLHKESQKLHNQLIEAVKESANVMTVNHTTNNNNQKFNLNFFLNTTCKDAMNMSEFIENMEVNFKDIENIGKNGYVTGMTDMIVSRIKELDVTKRPMHCTDLKRETMYIKDNNEWTRDTPENTKLHQMINYMAKQNYAKMPLWRQRNPECLDSDHPKYDFCIKMMRNMLGDVGAEQVRLDNKVIKNLSKHILVDKAAN
jgi:hypothetical protein